MLRIGLLLMIIGGIYISVKALNKSKAPSFVSYKITSIEARHANSIKVLADEDYHLLLNFDHQIDRHKKRPALSHSEKIRLLRCSNQIRDIKIYSTEKVNEAHPAGADLAGLFDFHYVRNLETKYGTLIKEGMTIPLSEFENLVDQDNGAAQVKILTLRMRQKPILQSEHQFIVQVFLENGEIRSDTTECIRFEGITTAY